MISLDKVEESILELESKDTTFATCEKLAMLYIVKDHLRGYEVKDKSPLTVPEASEFLKTVNGKSSDAVWTVMDELMNAVQALHPRMYEAVLDKIQAI